MSTLTGTLSREKGFTAFIRNHPLIAYFVLAYAGMWIAISPLVMDSFGWIELSDGLSLLLFVLYYGYIILIAVNPELLSRRIGASTTLGIPVGAAVIVGAWALTAAYVVWANRHYDPEVDRLRRRLRTD